MKRRHDWDNPQYDNGLSFIDMLFNFLLAFGMLLALALLQIRPPSTEATVKFRAEFVLTMTWPDGALDDIDMWVQLPDGRKVNFRHKDIDFATLDRDDLGALNDFYTDGNGVRQLTMMNREVVTIRAIVPGRYIVAAHVYAARPTLTDTISGKTWAGAPALPYQATLEVLKLNPRVVDVLKATVQLTEHGQEAVFAAFDIDADGHATNVELNPSQYQIVDLVPTSGPFGGAQDPMR